MEEEVPEPRRVYLSPYDRAFARPRCHKDMFDKRDYNSPKPIPTDRGGTGVGIGTGQSRQPQPTYRYSSQPSQPRQPGYSHWYNRRHQRTDINRPENEDPWGYRDTDLSREDRNRKKGAKGKCFGWIV